MKPPNIKDLVKPAIAAVIVSSIVLATVFIPKFVTFKYTQNLKTSFKPFKWQYSKSNPIPTSHSQTQEQEIPADIAFFTNPHIPLPVDGKPRNIAFDLPDKEVSKVTFSPQQRLVAYAAEKSAWTENPNGITKLPGIVKLYSLDTKENNQILEIEPKNYNISDYRLEIIDVSFSPDGNTIVITSSDSIWIYATTDKTSHLAFSDPVDLSKPVSERGVYGYYNPIFSPEGKKILISKGLWEATSYSWIDIGSGKMNNLPYYNFNWDVPEEDRAVEWLDESHLLVLRENMQNGTSAYRINVASLEEEELWNVEEEITSITKQGEKFAFLGLPAFETNLGHSDDLPLSIYTWNQNEPNPNRVNTSNLPITTDSWGDGRIRYLNQETLLLSLPTQFEPSGNYQINFNKGTAERVKYN